MRLDAEHLSKIKHLTNLYHKTIKVITIHFSSVHMKTWPSEKGFDSFPKSELAYRFESQFTGALFEILHICKSI